jgi:pseudouridine kinase
MDRTARPFDAVTIFGGATLDRVARTDGPPVFGASNPGSARRLPGGVGFNVATILSRLGLQTRLVTRIGADVDGEEILAAARTAGVDTSAVAVSATTPSAGYHAAFDNVGSLLIGIADMKVCDELSPAAVAPAAMASGAHEMWVVDANLPADTLAYIAEEAAHHTRPIAALTVSPAKAVKLAFLLDRVTYLFANRREAAALFAADPDEPSTTAASLAAELAAPRATKVVVTNGAEPLAAAAGADVRSFAPLKAAVKGVNGAGDSLAAGTILGLGEGLAFSDAIRFGLAAAALTLETGGVIAAPFSKDVLAERIAGGPHRAVS